MSFWENTAYISAAVSLTVWILTHLVQLVRSFVSQRVERNNFVRALFSEVDFNTKDLFFFLEGTRDLSKLKAALRKDTALIPHVTDAHHTIIYRENIDKLPSISDSLIAQLVHFYGLLDKIKEQIDGLNLPSFKTVSVEAKLKTIRRISANVEECEAIGNEILEQFKLSYANLELRRQFRSNSHDRRKTGF